MFFWMGSWQINLLLKCSCSQDNWFSFQFIILRCLESGNALVSNKITQTKQCKMYWRLIVLEYLSRLYSFSFLSVFNRSTSSNVAAAIESPCLWVLITEPQNDAKLKFHLLLSYERTLIKVEKHSAIVVLERLSLHVLPLIFSLKHRIDFMHCKINSVKQREML